MNAQINFHTIYIKCLLSMIIFAKISNSIPCIGNLCNSKCSNLNTCNTSKRSCPENSYYSNGFCHWNSEILCPKNMYYHRGICIVSEPLCSMTDSCIKSSSCSEGCPLVKYCDQDYILHNNMCLSQFNARCPYGTTLNSGFCMKSSDIKRFCPTGYTLNNNKCISNVKCPDNYVLHEGQCLELVCPENTYYSNGQCLENPENPPCNCNPKCIVYNQTQVVINPLKNNLPLTNVECVETDLTEEIKNFYDCNCNGKIHYNGSSHVQINDYKKFINIQITNSTNVSLEISTNNNTSINKMIGNEEKCCIILEPLNCTELSNFKCHIRKHRICSDICNEDSNDYELVVDPLLISTDMINYLRSLTTHKEG